jgi:hypothetical protein
MSITKNVAAPIAHASGALNDPPSKVGNVVLRGVTVALDTDVGQAFVADCCRNTEGLMPDSDVKNKWTLTDEDWERLANNAPLLQAVRAERERRIGYRKSAVERWLETRTIHRVGEFNFGARQGGRVT